MARQSATPQVAAIEPDESLYVLFDLSTGSAETASECDNIDPHGGSLDGQWTMQSSWLHQ